MYMRSFCKHYADITVDTRMPANTTETACISFAGAAAKEEAWLVLLPLCFCCGSLLLLSLLLDIAPLTPDRSTW